MSTDAKKYLDLGPFFPRKPLATPPARADGAAVAGASGLEEGDMSTGASKGGINNAVPTRPAIEKLDDTAHDDLRRP